MNWAAIGILFSVIVTCFNGIIFILLKFNDMKHLEINMCQVLTKVDDLAQRISRLEGVILVSVKKSRK